MGMTELAEALYYSLPDKYRAAVNQEAEHARVPTPEILVFQSVVVYLVAMPVILYFLKLSLIVSAAIFIGAIPVAFFLPYLILSSRAEKRKEKIEQVLPDALLLMSSNLRSGLTIDKAFMLSARDEFGPLAEEIRLAASDMFSGVPPKEAFESLQERTNSELFEETLRLIINGIKSGGDITQLLDSSAKDIRETLDMRKEAASNVATYSVLIAMAAVVGAPFLFAVSNFLVTTLTDLFSNVAIDVSQLPDTGPLSFSKPSLDPAFFHDFALAAITIVNGFAALIMAEIKHGTYKKGLKFVPVFIGLGIAVFFFADWAVQQVMGGITTG